MKRIRGVIICVFVLMSCSEDNHDAPQTLANYIEGRTIETGTVIACAASDRDSGDILIFYYPEDSASDIRYYETMNAEVDNSDLRNYNRIFLNPEPFFNGHLGKFNQSISNEKWIIVTFELDSEIKSSNPIRTKHISKPTVWNDEVTINQSQSGMPNFVWKDNPVGDNAIYFQVLSDVSNNLLSGTYTFENHFQYYNTSNVVLNVTKEVPPALILNENYNFTLMDVSKDNWVNWVIQKQFISE